MKTLDEVMENLNKKPETFKEKLEDLWFDITVYYPQRLRDGWWATKRFFRNLRKYWKILWTDNDFDYGYLEANIYYKLTWMADYFRTSRIAVGSEDTYHQINLALRLAEIAFEESISCEDSQLPYVNTKNWKRFVREEVGERFLKEPKSNLYHYFLEDLRRQKARKIFYEFMNRYSQSWWD